MRVIEEKHKHMSTNPQVDEKYLYRCPNTKYLYRCPNCGSLIEITKNEIEYCEYITDIWEYFSCPVCKECVDTPFIGRFLHRNNVYKFFHPRTKFPPQI